jgi:16S rRNA G966 N2-methylase RsmD
MDLISKNLKLCGLEAQGFALRKDLLKGFPRWHRLLEEKMDLVFVDPPYRKSMLLPVLEELCDRKILGSPSILVAQSEQREVLPPCVRTLQMVKSRAYGETRITIYRHEGQE